MIYLTGGGAGYVSRPFAIICASYPPGSICRCSCMGRTLKAHSALGICCFYLPYAGEWTVTATDGGKSVSKSLAISAQGQLENVTLRYSTLLFDEVSGLDAGLGRFLNGNTDIVQGTSGAYYLGLVSGEGQFESVSAITDNNAPFGGYSSLKLIYEGKLTVYAGNQSLSLPRATRAQTTLSPAVMDISAASDARLRLYVSPQYSTALASYTRDGAAVYKIWLE